MFVARKHPRPVQWVVHRSRTQQLTSSLEFLGPQLSEWSAPIGLLSAYDNSELKLEIEPVFSQPYRAFRVSPTALCNPSEQSQTTPYYIPELVHNDKMQVRYRQSFKQLTRSLILM